MFARRRNGCLESWYRIPINFEDLEFGLGPTHHNCERSQDSQKHQVSFFIRLTQNHASPYPIWQPWKIKIDILILFGLKRIVLRTPFFSVFKLKKVERRPRDPTPIVFSFDLFSFWAAASLKETPKNHLGENFIFVWVRQSPCKKNKSHNGTMALQKKHRNKTKNSRQFSSHALRYASLITCLPNSFLIGQMSRRDQSVRQTTKRGHLC